MSEPWFKCSVTSLMNLSYLSQKPKDRSIQLRSLSLQNQRHLNPHPPLLSPYLPANLISSLPPSNTTSTFFKNATPNTANPAPLLYTALIHSPPPAPMTNPSDQSQNSSHPRSPRTLAPSPHTAPSISRYQRCSTLAAQTADSSSSLCPPAGR